jgi:hypothetical protein
MYIRGYWRNPRVNPLAIRIRCYKFRINERIIPMERDIAERDWKVFKELHATATDRFFEKAVKDMQPMLWHKNKPAQERLWDALTYAKKQREQAAGCSMILADPTPSSRQG